MFLALTEKNFIKKEDIVGVFDIETATIKKATRDFLYDKNKEKTIKNLSVDIPKSFVVTKNEIYLSEVSTSTILKRLKKGW